MSVQNSVAVHLWWHCQNETLRMDRSEGSVLSGEQLLNEDG